MSAAVFLDIDGVLAPFGRRNPRVLDAACVERVHRLATVARVVLASSWPLRAAEEYIGLPLETLDADRRTFHGRPLAIWRWLQQHPEVTAWVSIDDDRIVETLQRRPDDALERALLAWPERFLRTDWEWIDGFGPQGGAGLTQRVYERARSILCRPAEIERVKAAIRRREADLAELEAEARGACCPSCLYGSRYTWLADKQERAEEWLRILKGRPE